MEMDLPEKIDFAAIDISLIDLSSQNDFQFSENLTDHGTHYLLVDASAEGKAGTDCAIVQFPILHETTEPEITHRKCKYNLRKSLAWDSAFFTSAGFLDPEELSTMLKGPEKSDEQLLPRIEEDISGSNESISTFETDILAVDSLENDLFGDIRASIQRSNKKASNSTNYSIKIETMEADNIAISSLQKDNIASEIKNPKPSLKKNSGLQTIRLSKSQPKQNMLKLGSGKAVKQDGGHSQVAQSTAKNDESNLVPKPPKAIGRSVLDSTAVIKQDALGRNRAKSECGSSKLVSEKVAQPPKPSILSGAQRPLPKPALPSKSASSRSSTTCRVQSTRSHTSSDSYSSLSSNAPAKSSLAAVRRNPVKSSCSYSASSSSIPKVPSRGAVRNKPSPSTLKAYVKSTKISSSVSPASSISEWSSVSSSSSIINQRSSNSRTSLETDSCRSISSDTTLLDPRNHSANQLPDGLENHELGLPGNSSTNSSARLSTLQAPVIPSGLRMPSPKMGFFDGAKLLVCTPKRTMQSPSSFHTVIPKSGPAVCSPNQGSNIKLRTGKASTARTFNAAANIKPDSPSWCLEVKGCKTGESCSEAQKQVVDAGAGSGAVVNENLAGFNVNKNMDFAGVKIPLVEGIDPSGCIGWRVDEGGRVEQNHLENNSHQSSVCTLKRTMQSPSSFHTVIPKSGPAVYSPNQGSNIQLKSDKTSTARTVNAAANIKPESPSWCLEVKGCKTGESCSEAQKQVVDAGAGSGAGAVVNENLAGFNVNNNMDFAGVKIPLVEGIDPSGCIGWRVDEGGRVEQNHLENNPHQTCNTGDKENHNAKDPGEMLKELNVVVNPYIPSSMAEILKEISDCVSLSPINATESAVPRSPFAPKNCLCDNELLDASKESTSIVADKTAFLLSLFEHNS